ncbi:coiled-coil domain-containing protein 137 [Gouania willdenowi]|uniref:Coiled-coil domain-containing protein 137 n=1 Tax=Gouania willdenowi TaxID=441366 RepID=A0A8C5DK99_GOUWI|nr:coiled-coil domain-containing protein 137 [Gouania willdenowi]
MGKTNKNKTNQPEKPVKKNGLQSSNTKLRKNVNQKKGESKHEDHISHIPFRLREILKSKDGMKNGPSKAKKVKAVMAPRFRPEESQVGDIPVPHFKRGKKESEKAYKQRMENETSHVLFLTNNQVDRKPELKAEEQEKPARSKSINKKEHDKGRLQRLQLRKLDRQEDKLEKDMFKDHVPFGEVAMAPPSFSSKPRKAQVKSQAAPKELLLNSLLGHAVSSTTKPSMAKQRIMEEERIRAVEAYRFLKKQKQQQLEARTAIKKRVGKQL